MSNEKDVLDDAQKLVESVEADTVEAKPEGVAAAESDKPKTEETKEPEKEAPEASETKESDAEPKTEVVNDTKESATQVEEPIGVAFGHYDSVRDAPGIWPQDVASGAGKPEWGHDPWRAVKS